MTTLWAACWREPSRAPHAPRDVPVTRAALSERLHATPAQLATLVDGPVAILDLDTEAISILCGAGAHARARAWGRLLADHGREQPRCYVESGDELRCIQAGTRPTDTTLWLDFRRAPTLRFVAAEVATHRVVVSETYKDLEWKLHEAARTATCAP